jgi:chromosome segregation ATPase
MAERSRLEGRLADADARREQLVAEVKDAQVAAESGLRIAAEFEAERTRLEQSVELLAGQHRAELAREAADQQRLHVLLDLAGQQHQDLRARLQDAELQCRERQVQLDQTVAAHRALQARVQALDAAQQEALTSHSAERARLEELVATAEAARDRHAEAVVNREVVLNALAEHSRRLTPLVTTGRLARELAPQLREIVERVDGLANQVLEDCQLDRPGRADLELLRADVIRAGALASELLSAGAESDVARVIIDRRGRTESRS